MTNANSVEQFNFDITEVQILENGNKFKGLKRGTATGKDGLKILANFFEYDKKTQILNAFGEVEIIDKANDFLIFAENITYYKKQEKIITKGNTKAIIESKYNLVSKKMNTLISLVLLTTLKRLIDKLSSNSMNVQLRKNQ